MGFGIRTVLLGAGVALPLVRYLRDEPVPMGPAARQDEPGSFTRLSHGITHYEVTGPTAGEPVLFIPGATLSQWIWDGLFERIAAAGARAIRYDRYGIGFSDRPDVDYDYDLFETQILELLDQLGIDRPITIVALAFGGPIAAEFAVRNPRRVARVCMIAPDGFGVPISPGLKAAMLPVVGQPFFKIVGDRALIARIPGYSADASVVARVATRFRPELRYRGSNGRCCRRCATCRSTAPNTCTDTSTPGVFRCRSCGEPTTGSLRCRAANWSPTCSPAPTSDSSTGSDTCRISSDRTPRPRRSRNSSPATRKTDAADFSTSDPLQRRVRTPTPSRRCAALPAHHRAGCAG